MRWMHGALLVKTMNGKIRNTLAAAASLLLLSQCSPTAAVPVSNVNDSSTADVPGGVLLKEVKPVIFEQIHTTGAPSTIQQTAIEEYLAKIPEQGRYSMGWLTGLRAACWVQEVTGDPREQAQVVDAMNTHSLVIWTALAETGALNPDGSKETLPQMLAKIAHAEAGGILTAGGEYNYTEMAGVMWCILNRADIQKPPEHRLWPARIVMVAKSTNQFAYHADTLIRADLEELAVDVLCRWALEKYLLGEWGRVLPREYLYFVGRNGHNYYRKKFDWRIEQDRWDWSLPSPYANTDIAMNEKEE